MKLTSGYPASLWSWLLNVEKKKAELHQKRLVQLRWRLLRLQSIVAVYLVRFTGVRRKRNDCGACGTQKGLIVSTPPQEALPTPR